MQEGHTIRRIPVSGFLAFWAIAPSLHAGILVSRSGQSLQFTDAVAITLNGKDKALGLGNQPKIGAPIGKLPTVHVDGTLLKDADSNTLALYGQGELTYLIPQGLPKNAPTDVAEIWRSARISYKKSASDKTPADIAAAAFVAFLPDGAEGLARLSVDERALQLIGGKDKAFAAQVELISAAVKAYPSDPALAPLQRYVEDSMRERYQRFESGAAGLDVLRQGLKFVELSQAAYPNQPQQEQLRKDLTGRKVWLDRKIAVLRAFAASGQWDAFLLGDQEFEKYHQAFPDIMSLRTDALKRSLQLHQQAGDARLKESEYGAAWREFRLASFRQPSDSALQQKVLMAWTDHSRRAAIDRQGKRKQLTAGQREAINQALLFATRYKEENKLDEALKSVLQAEAIDSESLPVMLKKAEVLGAQQEFSKALAALEQYDLRAVDDERQKSSQLRSELMFHLTNSLKDAKMQWQKAWSEWSFHKARDLALQGLRAKDDDPELLYQAGMASLVTRDTRNSRAAFTHYLEVSNTLDANAEQRALVRRLLPAIADAARPDEGDPNWLSGKKLPNGVYYDPVSLAFQPRVDHVDASNKLKVAFEWDGARLKSITPVFEKNEHPSGERKISFAYDDKAPQVASVAYENGARAPAAANPDDRFKSFSLVILNNPYDDPVAIQKLTGKNITMGVSGNRFFHPFVWDKIHFFRFTYDENGRVSQAREILDTSSGAPGDQWLEFDWNGLQLAAVRGYQGADEKHRVKNYERTLQYQDGRLVAEDIQSQGKPAHIKYTYNGNRLVSANCDKDLSLDDRSRLVTFR